MTQDASPRALRAYWRSSLIVALACLGVWALVSFGFGILLRPVLDNVSIGGAPLGFWFAQQGAIYVFVALIFVYAFAMNRLERKYRSAGRDGEA